MTFRTEKFGTGQALIIHAETCDDIYKIPQEKIRELYKSSGALIFRGFNITPVKLHDFANQFSTHFNRDRLRPSLSETEGDIQLVTEGTGYVEPHCEQANSPFKPDAIWFCCVCPPAEDGETLFWDGMRIWNNMNDSIKAYFKERRIRYFQKYPKLNWQLFLGGDADAIQVRDKLDVIPGVSYYFDDTESIYLEYLCPAIVKTKYGGEDAFANSLLSERANTLGEMMSFSDGTIISDDIIHEIESIMIKVEEQVSWQKGDMVFLDNTRYLHGRNAYTDTRRELYACMSFLNF